ncbi:magnesium transporter [Tissierella creatinini]|nr:magnesium transporter [Tissierella creatinini]TJX60546.1 magnesium transporter [Soehngenia saccharolytica]
MEKRLMELMKENKAYEIRSELLAMNIVDIAHILEEVDKHNLVRLFRILPKDMAAGVFSYFSPEVQQHIVEAITDNEIKTIIDELFLDDAVDFIEEMPANVVKKVIKNTDENLRKQINQFLNYPEDSSGTIMTIEYVDLKKEMSVKEAIDHIKKTGIDKETINNCYVIDPNRKLEGVISIRKLILSDESNFVEDIFTKDVISVKTIDDQEFAAQLFKKYDLMSMPVVDNENRLVGIITVDDIVDIIEKENTEDIQKMAAMEPSDEEYLKSGVFKLAKHRIIWLLVLMISATLTGNIIKKYDDVLQSIVILASFIPMLMDTGGNAGSQSSSLIIRGLALGEIRIKDALKVLWKELRVSIVVGSTLAFVNFLRIYYLEKVDFKIAITVCITTLLTVVLAKVVGGLLPIGAKALKMDPAIMASPLITTIVDTFALVIYFSIATLLLDLGA